MRLHFLLCLFLVGCGNLSRDVNHTTAYQSGGFIPGHIYRMKTDAVLARWGNKDSELVLMKKPREKQSSTEKWNIESFVPEGTRLHVDSITHHLVVAVTEENWLRIYGTVLDERHENLSAEIDYGVTYREGSRPAIPVLDPRYLEDVTSKHL